MGTIQDNFTPSWQTHLLRIWQPDKMLRDLGHNKRSRDLSALSMESLVSGVNHKVSNLVFSPCMSGCLPKVQDTAVSLLHCSPSPHFLQPTITCRLVIPQLNVAFSHSVPSQILFSITSGFLTSCFKQHCTFSCKVGN